MDNLHFLKQVLCSQSCYWIAARRETINMYGTPERQPDSIWIICIPPNIQLGFKEEEILLKDVEQLSITYVQNIAISDNYPPFQNGITMHDFYFGYPITENHKEVVIKALLLGADKKIWDYKELVEPKIELQTTQPATA